MQIDTVNGELDKLSDRMDEFKESSWHHHHQNKH